MTLRDIFSSRIETRPPFLSMALLAVVITGASSCNQDSTTGNFAAEVVAAKVGPLRIIVTEGGDMESANPTIVRSEVEGRSSILELVGEGTQVKKGDFVFRLDQATIQDNLNRQEIKLEDARNSEASAHEALEIQKKKNIEDLKTAGTNFELAVRALEGYEKGTSGLEIQKLKSALLLATERMNRAEEKAGASKTLLKDKYISETEYEADKLAFKQAYEEVNIATANIVQFETWTQPDQMKKLQTEVDVKRLAVDRVEQQAQSELKQRQDILDAKKKNYALEKVQRDKLASQLAKTEVLAPSDGLVVYARRNGGGRMGGSSEPIGLGTEVREQEEIIRIPDLSNMVVEVDIHESSIKKVKAGLPCWVRVDALPGRVIPGKVTRVSLVPSSQSSWMNPDLKVYQTKVKLEETVDGVKPGMHAQVEIQVDEIANALQVPIQAIRQSGSRTFAYVKNGSDVEIREVKVGQNSQTSVHIMDGMKEGELVYLSKPAGAPDLPPPEKPEFRATTVPDGTPAVPGSGDAPGAGAARGGPVDDGNLTPPAQGGGAGGGRGAGRGQMSEEDRKKMAERMKNMTPEEIEKFRQGRRGGNRPPGSGGGDQPANSNENDR